MPKVTTFSCNNQQKEEDERKKMYEIPLRNKMQTRKYASSEIVRRTDGKFSNGLNGGRVKFKG